MSLIPMQHFLIFGLIIFSIGIYGILTRRNAIGVLISIELMINAININFITFSRHTSIQPQTGQIFSFFIIALAAAAAAVGLAIVLALYRNKGTIEMDEINLLKW